MSEEITPEQAKDVLRREYWTAVRDMAEEIVKECRDGTIEDREALFERVEEECDGTAWVIYTVNAQQVLMCSDNDSAYFDEMGGSDLDVTNGVPWSTLAYFAMRADLLERIGADIDVNDDSGWREEEETEEEEE